MAIPRQLIVFAASAAVAGIVLYARNRMKEAEERTKAAKRRPTHPDGASSSSSSTGEAPASAPSSTTADAGPALTGAVKELSLFLAGESWYDEVGWQGIWEREGVASPDGWLKSEGKNVLVGERKKLSEHPALLAGCRRRWIVVCRYAGIDVADAAALWNQTE
jgi:hypothetical protein